MTKHRDGSYIDLNWEYDGPDWYAIRGWHDAEAYQNELDEYYGEEGWTEEYTRGDLEHGYARWEFHGAETGHWLQVYSEPQRGRFPVTWKMAKHRGA